MKTESDATGRKWWRPEVPAYEGWALVVMRVLFAVLVFHMIKWETGPYIEQKFPHGLARWVDLTWLSQHPPGLLWQGVTVAGLLFYAIGWAPLLGLTPALFFAISIGTLVTSQSKNVNHTWQMVTMMLLAQWLVYAWEAAKKQGFLRPGKVWHRIASQASVVVIAASYVVCGIVKLVNSDFQWIQKVPLLSVQLLKSNWANFYDTLQPPPAWLERATQLIVEYPNLARVFFGAGLLIELGAFVILISRRWAFWGGLCIVLLHVSISKVMQLNFENHIAAALIFLVIPNTLAALRRGDARAG
ncbi:MAG: hypothetical protein KDK99_10510 [Verrucomicrobiales bacterium]|nr:hypothetical protein [Verrucomicrobiales bacterium]